MQSHHFPAASFADRSSVPLAVHFPALQHQEQHQQLQQSQQQYAFYPQAPVIVTNLPGLSYPQAQPPLNAVHPQPENMFILTTAPGMSTPQAVPLMAVPLVPMPIPAAPIQPQVPSSVVQGVIATAPVTAMVADEDSPLKNASSASIGESLSGLRRKRRQRSAFTHELTYKGRYNPDTTNCMSRIRIWTNSCGLQYYDCECGKRKPVQDLYKIKQHVNRHDVEEHVCTVCSKVFKHHLQMNAHMKVHKRDSSKPVVSELESDSTSPSGSSYSASISSSSSTELRTVLISQKEGEEVRVQA